MKSMVGSRGARVGGPVRGGEPQKNPKNKGWWLNGKGGRVRGQTQV